MHYNIDKAKFSCNVKYKATPYIVSMLIYTCNGHRCESIIIYRCVFEAVRMCVCVYVCLFHVMAIEQVM